MNNGTFTSGDKKTLIFMFAILTLATVLDIVQEFTNNNEANKDRQYLVELKHRNLNMSQVVIDHLIANEIKAEEMHHMHTEILKTLDQHSGNVTKLHDDENEPI